MIGYNENLHSTVVESLNDQNLEIKRINAELQTSMFSLYYAAGARINALEKLDASRDTHDFQNNVLHDTANISNISNNVLLSANTESALVDQAISNMDTAAANTQIAANSIVKLASDMGSIASIVSAGDLDTSIYKMTQDVYQLISTTAFQAEKAAQYAMEASMYTAEIPAKTVASDAVKTNDSISHFLTQATSDAEASAETVKLNAKKFRDDSSDEKLAEGKLEDTNVQLYAALSAYTSSNNVLNLNLRTLDTDHLGFTVNFNYYESPFPSEVATKDDETEKSSKTNEPVYPVQDYYVLLVKEEAKNLFSLTNADAIVANDPNGNNKSFIHIVPDPDQNSASQKIGITDLNDVEGNPMVLGQRYVVFVLAQFNQDYKVKTNNFDDYLTAASLTFALTNTLNCPNSESIRVNDVNGAITVSFSVAQNPELLIDYPSFEAEYRCMFLPNDSELIKGLLTDEGLKSLEKEIEQMERIAEKFAPLIASVENKKRETQSACSQINAEIDNWNYSNPDFDRATPAAKETKAQLDARLEKCTAELAAINIDLEKLKDAKTATLTDVMSKKSVSSGFFFNLTLAENVPAGNYSKALLDETTESEVPRYTVIISEMTTDNFGHPLTEGESYIPVVLSFAAVNASDLNGFTHSLSDFTATPFTYHKQINQ